MAESEARDWVLVWVEDLHRRAESKRFWEEEQERIDLGIAAHFSALSILTILLDKCQTKSFEDMNILIKAILKFCTTNQQFI